MAKTANAYVSDQGEVVVTLSAANISAVAAFTTAEDITIDGALRAFRRTNDPQKAVARTNVTGDLTPIVTRSNRVQEEEQWELVLVDDYFAGETGEWGTDNLAAVEIFWELLDNNEDPGGLKCTPAGGATGDIEITLTTPRLLSVGVPEIDADKTEPEQVTVTFACEGHTVATHS